MKTRQRQRRQYDVIAQRDGRTILAECKQWSGGRYRLSALKQAVAKHRERAIFYTGVTGMEAVPVIVVLVEETIRVVDGVPLVPVHRLNAFIGELDMFADGMAFEDPGGDPEEWDGGGDDPDPDDGDEDDGEMDCGPGDRTGYLAAGLAEEDRYESGSISGFL